MIYHIFSISVLRYEMSESISSRDSTYGNFYIEPLTASDAEFYRHRVDELHSVYNSLIDHYQLNANDYAADIGSQKPHADLRIDQLTLLAYNDGLCILITGFVRVDIMVTGSDQSFYNQQAKKLDYDLNLPERFKQKYLAIAA